MVRKDAAGGDAVVQGNFFLDGFYRDPDGCEEEVEHDEGPEDHHRHVQFFGAGGGVAECEDETGGEDTEVHPFEDDGEDLAGWEVDGFVGEADGENAEDEEEVALANISIRPLLGV